MNPWKIVMPLLLCAGFPARAQLPDIAPVSDATLPPTSERQELGRDTRPDHTSGRSLREARRAWDIPWWSPAPTPSLYPMSRSAPLGETPAEGEISTPPVLSR